MGRYREEKNLAIKKMKNTIYLQTIQSEGLMVYSECDLSTIGPCVAILIKESIKERPG